MQLNGQCSVSEEQDEVMTALLTNTIPYSWLEVSYPTTKTLSAWLIDLGYRSCFFRQWASIFAKSTPILWLSAFFFPKSLITACLQMQIRKLAHMDANYIPGSPRINTVTLTSLEIVLEITDMFFENADSQLLTMSDQILVYGIFMDQGFWNLEERSLAAPVLGQNLAPLPVVILQPRTISSIQANTSQKSTLSREETASNFIYLCPLYQTQSRRGSVGQSSNHILSSPLPVNEPEEKWILRGTAMVLDY